MPPRCPCPRESPPVLVAIPPCQQLQSTRCPPLDAWRVSIVLPRQNKLRSLHRACRAVHSPSPDRSAKPRPADVCAFAQSTTQRCCLLPSQSVECDPANPPPP